jgi:nitronate monooxygenase
MRELDVMNADAPEFPLAISAVAAIRAKLGSEAAGDFSSFWCGQNASGCKEVSAAELTHSLAAEL